LKTAKALLNISISNFLNITIKQYIESIKNWFFIAISLVTGVVVLGTKLDDHVESFEGSLVMVC